MWVKVSSAKGKNVSCTLFLNDVIIVFSFIFVCQASINIPHCFSLRLCNNGCFLWPIYYALNISIIQHRLFNTTFSSEGMLHPMLKDWTVHTQDQSGGFWVCGRGGVPGLCLFFSNNYIMPKVWYRVDMVQPDSTFFNQILKL